MMSGSAIKGIYKATLNELVVTYFSLSPNPESRRYRHNCRCTTDKFRRT